MDMYAKPAILPDEATILWALQLLMEPSLHRMPLETAKRVHLSHHPLDRQNFYYPCPHGPNSVSVRIDMEPGNFTPVVLECQRMEKPDVGIVQLWIGQCETCGRVYWDGYFRATWTPKETDDG